MRAILTARKTRKAGKRAALAGYFYISIAELQAAVEEAEEQTAGKAGIASKKAGQEATQQAISTLVPSSIDDEDVVGSDFDKLALQLNKNDEMAGGGCGSILRCVALTPLLRLRHGIR